MKISVCIPTYRRAAQLTALLDDIVKQSLLPDQVVVVDNDAQGSGRAIVERRRWQGVPFTLVYAIQPEKNIALTRNLAVTLADGDWIAFVDDDERAPANWLEALVATAVASEADGVLGPVEPVIPAGAPTWIRRGGFYRWARFETGARVPRNKLRFGNVLLRSALLQRTATPFDARYGLTGGEDGDFLSRMAQDGAVLVWCDEALIHEPVEASRLSFYWLMLRSLRGGQDYARHWLNGRFGAITVVGRAWFMARALSQTLVAASLALLSLPLGRHRAAHWLLKAVANVGKISIVFGMHYQEYGEKRT